MKMISNKMSYQIVKILKIQVKNLKITSFVILDNHSEFTQIQLDI